MQNLKSLLIGLFVVISSNSFTFNIWRQAHGALHETDVVEREAELFCACLAECEVAFDACGAGKEPMRLPADVGSDYGAHRAGVGKISTKSKLSNSFLAPYLR